ncbi:hypothetical protein ABES23_19165 [Peribacillus frigoritolerans]|uniref:hypothetical protein n=1 Tax=Peribacillus frigoritolerans TaxID=450367 RepID=UPI001EDDC398|nr:hypothetical protein [Peribacillus frigoritolerans]MCP1490240.1 nucleoside-diphosphate-sugar epimerase [Peribacillus frigoritolerans]
MSIYQTGIENEILGIYEDILEVFNKDLPIEITGPRNGDVKRSVLDCTLAKEKLDWEPQYTLKEGLEKLRDYLI